MTFIEPPHALIFIALENADELYGYWFAQTLYSLHPAIHATPDMMTRNSNCLEVRRTLRHLAELSGEIKRDDAMTPTGVRRSCQA